MNKRILNYLNISRFLIIGLIISQITTFCVIGQMIQNIKDEEMNEKICIEEIIPNYPPLEVIR